MAAGLELVQDAAELWGSAGRIRILCKEILQLLDHECVESEEVEDYANEGSSSVTRIFREIWELARDILSSEEAANECMEVIPRAEWVQACSRRILCATRRIEELLGPGRALEVLSSADPEAAQADEAGTVTHPTALPHAPPPVAGSVTADTWSDFGSRQDFQTLLGMVPTSLRGRIWNNSCLSSRKSTYQKDIQKLLQFCMPLGMLGTKQDISKRHSNILRQPCSGAAPCM